MQLNNLCFATGKCSAQQRQYRRHFQGKVSTGMKLTTNRLADVTELTETMLNESARQQPLITLLISSSLIISQQLFETCFRWSVLP